MDRVHRKISFPCPECDSTFFSTDGVTKHMKIKHSKDSHPLKCEECGKTFTKRNRLHCHMASHEKVMSQAASPFFLLLYCNLKSLLQVLPHDCKTCGKRFLYPSQLKRHQARYHEDQNKKKYPCAKREGFNCTKVFETWSEARKHAAQEHR